MVILSLFFACQDATNEKANSNDNDTENTEPIIPVPETSEYTIEHQGLERSYWLHIPESIGSAAPLVVVMHGFTGSAQGIMDYSEMNRVADENGFAVVYPQGTEDNWGMTFFNVGYDFHGDQTVDDIDFIRTLVAELQQSHGLSQTEVFSTGMSNGGDMSYYLACEADDVFKAIAPVAGTMMSHIYSNCSPSGSMPVFELHGTQDDVTYWGGDPTNEDGWGVYLDIPSIIDFWANHNGLLTHETIQIEDSSPNDGSTVVFERYGTDADPAQVWLYRIENGGHDWPGVWGNMDVHASDALWEFFEIHREN